MKAKIKAEDIYEVELYFKGVNLITGIKIKEDEDLNFYDYQTQNLKLYFENINEINDLIKTLEYFKNYLKENKLDEIHIDK